jgi:hypothetical protein
MQMPVPRANRGVENVELHERPAGPIKGQAAEPRQPSAWLREPLAMATTEAMPALTSGLPIDRRDHLHRDFPCAEKQ